MADAVPSIFTSFPEPPPKKTRRPPRERIFESPEAPTDEPVEQSNKASDDETLSAQASGFLHNISAEEQLARQVAELKDRVSELEKERNALLAHAFSAERILEDNDLLQFYTGFSSKDMFMACFDFLKDSAESVRTWQGSRTKLDGERRGQKPGPERKMSLISFSLFVYGSVVGCPWRIWPTVSRSLLQPSADCL